MHQIYATNIKPEELLKIKDQTLFVTAHFRAALGLPEKLESQFASLNYFSFITINLRTSRVI